MNKEMYSGVLTTIPNQHSIFCKITAAADVDASGYTITDGKDFIKTAAKNTEGKLKLTFKQPQGQFVTCKCSVSAGDFVPFFSAEDADHATAPYVELIFRKHSASAAATADPDSAVLYIELVFATNSSYK